MLRIAAACAASPAFAADLPPLTCTGEAPAWQVTVDGDSATMDFGRKVALDIPQRATAEGRDWPLVLTLIGQTDTAILVLDARACGTDPYTATLLTQRGSTPLVLAGCCTATP